MVAEIVSGAVAGIDGFGVSVEIDIARGLPAFAIVGLPNAAVRESRERVTAAIKNNGFAFPQKRITVNLAPADVRKEGAAFDLPIALGILAASGAIPCAVPRDALIVGELALDGRLKAVRGALPIACHARERGCRRLIVPEANASEAALVAGIEIAPCRDLMEAIGVLSGAGHRSCPRPAAPPERPRHEFDYGQVIAQNAAKRALQVAAAGEHHVIMVGPPGSGKTMLARRLPSLMPPLSEEEALECAKIMSVSGRPSGGELPVERPFRSPHHSASDAGLVGGGRGASPGEITLAHHGILFLDELTEFKRNVLESLRQPIEEGRIVIARANASLSYPARFQLVAAMNPCPCGFAGSPAHECRCTPIQMRRYLAKISGPLLDRIAIHVPVRAVDAGELDRALAGGNGGEISSADLRPAVLRAVEAQRRRYIGAPGIRRNADLPLSAVESLCEMTGESAALLAAAQRRLLFSARSRRNIIQVARTIADLDSSARIEAPHVAEAIQYRVPRFLGD